jgi:mRNA interferase MazF
VVQDDVFNHSRITTVVVCALTSDLHRANEPGNVLLEVREGELPKQSVVLVSQVSSVDKARLGERIGSLSDTRVEQILAGLRFQQVSFFGRQRTASFSKAAEMASQGDGQQPSASVACPHRHHVELAEGYIRIMGKGRKERVVPLGRAAT